MDGVVVFFVQFSTRWNKKHCTTGIYIFCGSGHFVLFVRLVQFALMPPFRGRTWRGGPAIDCVNSPRCGHEPPA
jgi:hypothetical protein